MLNALKNHFLGDLPEFSNDPLGFVESIALDQKKPISFQLGTRRVTLLSRPSAIRHVLLDCRDRYTKGAEQKKMRSLMGEGLITSNGARWQESRHAMKSTFNAASLIEGLNLALAVMGQEIALLATQTDKAIDLKLLLGRMTIRMAAAALFHERLDQHTSEMIYEACLVAHHRLTNSMMSLIDFSMFFPTRENRAYKKAVSNIEGVISGLINNPKGLLKDILPLRDVHGPDVLRDESITMLIAGFETTATVACWLVYALAENPLLVEWIRPEIDALLNQSDRIDATFIRQMPKTKALVQEVLRLYPSAWWFARQSLVDDSIDGTPIKKGSSLLICPWVLHRHSDLWPNPNNLDPERFFQDYERDKFSYIPFGAGPRMCIGHHLGTSELVGIAAAFVSAFDMKSLSGPLETLKPYGGLTLALPDKGLKISLRARSTTTIQGEFQCQK